MMEMLEATAHFGDLSRLRNACGRERLRNSSGSRTLSVLVDSCGG